MRLNKYLSASGVCSRREADRLIREGLVSVNGISAAVGQDVSDGDTVAVRGHAVRPAEEEIFLAVNKPRGVVVTTDRSHGDRVLEDLVPKNPRVFAVGRLDKESEGLILMTNNGDVSNRIQKARYGHEKEYLVSVDRKVTRPFLDGLRGGVYLPELERKTRPCIVRQTGGCSFDMILTEGLNRQIRRMCGAFGYRVLNLRRIRVMNVLLGNLQPGAYRRLSGEEVQTLKSFLRTEKGNERQQTD